MRSAKSLLKTTLNAAVRPLGISVSHLSPSSNYLIRLRKLLDSQAVSLVIDVGANTGQYARELIQCGYQGSIISVEPLSAAHRELLLHSQRFKRWTIAPRMALGESPGNVEINVSKNSVSSSLRSMLALHTEMAPNSETISREAVEVCTLDSFLEEWGILDESLFLKVDTQGFEKEVLRGGKKALAHARVLQLELSVVPLYSGQALIAEMLSFVEGAGFTLHSLEPAFWDVPTGRVFQYDALFSRVAL